jgi:hypothetical protein
LGLYAESACLFPSLSARYAGVHLIDIQSALDETRSLVRLRAMRGRTYAVPAPMLPLVFQATRRQTREAADRLLRESGIRPQEYLTFTERIARLVGKGSLTAGEIKAGLTPLDARIDGAFNYLLDRMCAEGSLVLSKTQGTWRSGQTEYSLLSEWLPGLNLQAVEPDEACVRLAFCYFRDYGPATIADFKYWSGFNHEEINQALGGLHGLMAPVDVEGSFSEYYLLRDDLEVLWDPTRRRNHRVSLLPFWDAYLMAYCERNRYLRPEWYERVFNEEGDSTAVVLIDGQVAGVWDVEEDRKDIVLKVATFEPQDGSVWSEIQERAVTIAAEIQPEGSEQVRLLRCPPPPPLTEAAQDRFRSPLREAVGELVRSV